MLSSEPFEHDFRVGTRRKQCAKGHQVWKYLSKGQSKKRPSHCPRPQNQRKKALLPLVLVMILTLKKCNSWRCLKKNYALLSNTVNWRTILSWLQKLELIWCPQHAGYRSQAHGVMDKETGRLRRGIIGTGSLVWKWYFAVRVTDLFCNNLRLILDFQKVDLQITVGFSLKVRDNRNEHGFK